MMSMGYQAGYIVVLCFRVLLSILSAITGAMVLLIMYPIILLMSCFDKADEMEEMTMTNGGSFETMVDERAEQLNEWFEENPEETQRQSRDRRHQEQACSTRSDPDG